MRRLLATATLLTVVLFALAQPALAANPRVLIKTSAGDITVELAPDRAPGTVQNFLTYVDEGFYAGTQFHRVIKGFMIQGGGYTADFTHKPTHAPIPNEAENGLPNERGTIAMARAGTPHSATAQFFINQADNAFLNHQARTPKRWGYTVFGHVVSGMDVVDKIAAVPTGDSPKGLTDVPKTPVIIESISRIDAE
jgi:cyclophilin family peptidyl-prolyl cis-trans isomerase